MDASSLMREIKCAKKSSFLPFPAKFCCWEKSQITLTAPEPYRCDILVPPSFSSHSSRTLVRSSWPCKSGDYIRVQGLVGPRDGLWRWGKTGKSLANWLDRWLHFILRTRVQRLPYLSSAHILSFLLINLFPRHLQEQVSLASAMTILSFV